MRKANYILVLLFVYVGIVAFLNEIRYDKEQQYLDHTSQLLQTTYDASLQRYALAMDTFYTSVLRHPTAVPLLVKGINSTGEQQNEARNELYRQLRPQFRDLIVRGIRQWQFHDADGNSFLRFHAPEMYGDNLLPVRSSLRQMQTQPIPRYGFEVGRLFIGFRFIHPIFTSGELTGTMETAVSFREVSEDLASLASGQAFLFLLHRESVEEVSFADNSQAFEPSVINSGYLVDRDSLLLSENITLPLDVLRTQMARLNLQGKLDQGDPFALALYHNSIGYSAAFIPVLDFDNRPAGYIVALQSASILTSTQWEFFSALGISLVVMCLLGWLLLNLHRQRLEMQSQKQQLDAIGQAVGEGIYVQDPQGQTVYINEAVTRLTGFNATKLYQGSLHNLLHSHEENGQLTLSECPIFVNPLNGQSYEGDEQFRTRTGELIPVVVTSRPLWENGEITGVVTVFRDISERKETERKLQELATTDPLTGLSNRRAFLERLEEELRLSRRLKHQSTLLMLDFDHFKQINDNYGHSAGDAVLKHFAAEAGECLRKTDLLGRLGGEEFAILLPGTDMEGARHLAELIRERMEQNPTQLESGDIAMTLSIGMTAIKPGDKNTSDVLNRADKALYQAKEKGRNQVRAA